MNASETYALQDVVRLKAVARWAGHRWGDITIPAPQVRLDAWGWEALIAGATLAQADPDPAGWGTVTLGPTCVVASGRYALRVTVELLTVTLFADGALLVVYATPSCPGVSRAGLNPDGTIWMMLGHGHTRPRDAARLAAALMAYNLDYSRVREAVPADVRTNTEYRDYLRMRSNIGALFMPPI